jgi:hypothetical protein
MQMLEKKASTHRDRRSQSLQAALSPPPARSVPEAPGKGSFCQTVSDFASAVGTSRALNDGAASRVLSESLSARLSLRNAYCPSKPTIGTVNRGPWHKKSPTELQLLVQMLVLEIIYELLADNFNMIDGRYGSLIRTKSSHKAIHVNARGAQAP